MLIGVAAAYGWDGIRLASHCEHVNQTLASRYFGIGIRISQRESNKIQSVNTYQVKITENLTLNSC